MTMVEAKAENTNAAMGDDAAEIGAVVRVRAPRIWAGYEGCRSARPSEVGLRRRVGQFCFWPVNNRAVRPAILGGFEALDCRCSKYGCFFQLSSGWMKAGCVD